MRAVLNFTVTLKRRVVMINEKKSKINLRGLTKEEDSRMKMHFLIISVIF